MDELINLFPTNSPVHSVFLLVDASIVRLVKENAEVGAVDEVVRPVINQNITHHHLFVVSDDDVVASRNGNSSKIRSIFTRQVR